MPDLDPRQRAKRYFQRAGPVDTALERILFEPCGKLALDLCEEFAAAGKAECLCQQDQMLVAVQFPDDFVVAGT
jgi:hypothetical protein